MLQILGHGLSSYIDVELLSIRSLLLEILLCIYVVWVCSESKSLFCGSYQCVLLRNLATRFLCTYLRIFRRNILSKCQPKHFWNAKVVQMIVTPLENMPLKSPLNLDMPGTYWGNCLNCQVGLTESHVNLNAKNYRLFLTYPFRKLSCERFPLSDISWWLPCEGCVIPSHPSFGGLPWQRPPWRPLPNWVGLDLRVRRHLPQGFFSCGWKTGVLGWGAPAVRKARRERVWYGTAWLCRKITTVTLLN